MLSVLSWNYRQCECLTWVLGTEFGYFARAVGFPSSPSLKMEEEFTAARNKMSQTVL